MLRASEADLVAAAIYPPPCPLPQEGERSSSGRAEAASLCNRDPAGHNQGMCRAWALVAVRDGLERTAWFVMAGGRSQHQKC